MHDPGAKSFFFPGVEQPELSKASTLFSSNLKPTQASLSFPFLKHPSQLISFPTIFHTNTHTTAKHVCFGKHKAKTHKCDEEGKNKHHASNSSRKSHISAFQKFNIQQFKHLRSWLQLSNIRFNKLLYCYYIVNERAQTKLEPAENFRFSKPGWPGLTWIEPWTQIEDTVFFTHKRSKPHEIRGWKMKTN